MKKFFEKLSSVDLFASPSKRKYLLLIGVIIIIVVTGFLAIKHFYLDEALYLDEDFRENNVPEVFVVPKLEPVGQEYPIAEPTTPAEISELCLKYEKFISEISCEEAARLALSEYVGKIHTIRPIPIFPDVENRWQIGINLITPIEDRTSIEVFITKDKEVVLR